MGAVCYLGFMVILFLLATASSQNTDGCPSECNCTSKGHLTCRDMTSFPQSFTSSAEIVSIYLSNFSVIPSNAFSKLPNMKILDMYAVSIGTIESCAFQNLHNMSRISIYNANIDTIKKGAFRSLLYDGYFSMYMSHIGNIESYAFTEVAKIKSFTVFNSNISTIQPRAFHKFSDLAKFSIYSSNITHIKSGAFEDFRRIQTFSLHENYIQRMDCNTVETLTRDLGQAFSFTRILVHCDCNIIWMIKQASSKSTSRLPLSTTACKEPITLHGAPLTALIVSQVCPGDTEARMSCPPLPPEDPATCTEGAVPAHYEPEHGHDHHDGHNHDHHGHGHSGCTRTWKAFSVIVLVVCTLMVL